MQRNAWLLVVSASVLGSVIGLASACGFNGVGSAISNIEDSSVSNSEGAADSTALDGNVGPDSNATDAAVDAAVDATDATTDGSTNICDGRSLGARVCVGAGSGSCVSSGGPLSAQPDRACPPGSTCSGGYCQPPASAATCQKPADCTGGKVCDLYVVGGLLAGRCTDPIPGAMGALYTSCTSNAACKTGFCSIDGEDSTHKECLFPCSTDQDCPNGASCHLIGTPPAIEGVSTATGKACYQ